MAEQGGPADGTLRALTNGVGSRHSEASRLDRSEEHTSELQSLMRLSYAVFCLQKNKDIAKKLGATKRIDLDDVDDTHHQHDHSSGCVGSKADNKSQTLHLNRRSSV